MPLIAPSEIVEPLLEVARIPKCEGDYGWPCGKGVSERVTIQCRRDVVHREATVGQFPHHVDVALDGSGGTKKRADTTEPSVVGYGGRELAGRGSAAHRRQNDRHVDTENVT